MSVQEAHLAYWAHLESCWYLGNPGFGGRGCDQHNVLYDTWQDALHKQHLRDGTLFASKLTSWVIGPDGHAFGLLDGPWAGCRETTVFWPEEESCDAECCLPTGHGGDRHYDQVLGWWQ